MSRTIKALVASALLVPGLALADELSYSFLEGSWIKGDNGAYSGFGVKGSLEFMENFHGFASYRDLDDLFGTNVDATVMEAGLGLNQSLTPNVDLVATISYLDAELDPGDSENGIAVRGLLRGRVGSNFELEGGVSYTDLSDLPEDTGIIIGGRYYVSPTLAIGASVESTGVGGIGSGLGFDEQLSLGLRWNFK